jgi:hypothetical protein
MYHEDSPEFHEAGWTEIVTSKCINLDTVHSIIASARTVDKHTETIGDIEIRFGSSDAGAKKITTASTWTAAWRRAARALVFAFPHRADELNTYSEYLTDKFEQMREGTHGRVVRFDKAVRNRVASSRKYLLSDLDSFRDLYDSHFFPDGKYYIDSEAGNSTATQSSGKSASATGKREPCIKWNNNQCSRSATACRYAHTCSFKQDGHVCGQRHAKAKHLEDSKPQ